MRGVEIKNCKLRIILLSMSSCGNNRKIVRMTNGEEYIPVCCEITVLRDLLPRVRLYASSFLDRFVVVYLERYSHLQSLAQLTALKASHAILKSSNETLITEVQQLRSANDTLKQQLPDLNDLSDKTANIKALQRDVSSLQATVDSLTHKINNERGARTSTAQLSKDLKDVKTHMKKFTDDLDARTLQNKQFQLAEFAAVQKNVAATEQR
ncbi:hypothetical protein V1514DRAFT_23262 [Lipomyces japonicus]|uniref:uncharacterized protein n=1 Tax=Lipomyces japonicus TaxID=56871 RepID=UPI0034CFD374